MSPIRKDDLNTNIIPISPSMSPKDVYELINKEINEKPIIEPAKWFLILTDVGDSYAIMRVSEFLDQYSAPRQIHITIRDVLRGSTFLDAFAIEQNNVLGIDHAKDILHSSGKQVLVVLDRGQPVGLVLEPTRSFDEAGFPQIDSTTGGESTRTSQEAAVESEEKQVLTEEEQPAKADPRYTKVWLFRKDADQSKLPKTYSVVAGNWYDLGINIGEWEDSAVENSKKYPFPSHLLPEQEGGYWLQAIAVSDAFFIPKQRYDFFLPNQGESWICDCTPDSDHEKDCNRRPYVHIPLRAPTKLGLADMRLGIYYQNNLIESQHFTANVTKQEEAGDGYSSRIDYSLVSRLDDLESFRPRTLNILTNQNQDGTHRFVINGLEDGVLSFAFSESAMQAAINEARQGLRNLYMVGMGSKSKKPSSMGEIRERMSVSERLKRIWEHGLIGSASPTGLSRSNAKSKDAFIADLRRLAPLGCYLYTHLVIQNSSIANERFRQHLRLPGVIQVARIRNSQFVFPWGLVYDIPLETSHPEKFRLCRLVEQWENLQETILNRQTRDCPFEAEHETNTLCPYGFWGFRHIIEQPASVRPPTEDLTTNGRLRTCIPCKPPLEVVAAVSTQLDPEISKAHLENLRGALPGFELQSVDTTTELMNRLSTQDIEVLYFYCHGKDRAITEGTLYSKPYLEIGKEDKIETTDLLAWLSNIKNRWDVVHPLVFINGCHTAELSPEALVSFVDMFALVNASGVIGTEITMHQLTASEAAEQFLTYFGQQSSVGQALQKMRMHFLAKGNLLGLAYTSYCSSDLVLSNNPL